MAPYDTIRYDGPSFLNEWTDLRRWYDTMDFPEGEGCRFRACLSCTEKLFSVHRGEWSVVRYLYLKP